MGAFENRLSEGYATSGFVRVIEKPEPTQKFCGSCEHYKNGANAQLCAAPAFSQPEPLFYAILKCGSERKWHTI